MVEDDYGGHEPRRRRPPRRPRRPHHLVLGVVAVIAGVIAVVSVVLLAYLDRSDVTAKLADTQRELVAVQDQAADLRRQADCAAGLAAEVDVAQLDNAIAYDDYVLALGSGADRTVAEQALRDARADLDTARTRRDATDQLCG